MINVWADGNRLERHGGFNIELFKGEVGVFKQG